VKRVHRINVRAEIVRELGAKQTTHRKLIDTPDGADRFVLTEFEVEPDGSTPPHHHDWEHEIYVLEGQMGLVLPAEGRSEQVKEGDAIFIPRNEPHGFVTGPGQRCRFLVVAPSERPPVRSVFLSEDPYEYTQTPEYMSAKGFK
jgi:quercetin dioxygenase-like cupin family protein